MPNDSLNSDLKGRKSKRFKILFFLRSNYLWFNQLCISKKKDVEATLCRRAKWLTKWTFTIGKKVHISIKVVNVIQRNMQRVLTVKIWGMENHLSSFCSLQPRVDIRFDFTVICDGHPEVSCQQQKHSRRMRVLVRAFLVSRVPPLRALCIGDEYSQLSQ